MDHVKALREAYATKSLLLNAASPSNPNYGKLTDEEWLAEWNEINSIIYALEESLAALSP